MQVSLGDLVQDTGLSRFQLVRRFRDVTGLPPLAWQINERIIRARSRLRAGCGLAEVSNDLGFADHISTGSSHRAPGSRPASTAPAPPAETVPCNFVQDTAAATTAQ
ncbi:helix-turn-helix domain-containing protein [Nocardia sp. NPDC002869]|uniref:helix-turn-helix domain-containing protein n=1 Tax=Nocardia sp. NPDC002869 TaxID=3161032 RepID=UPI00398D53F3